MPDLRFIQVDAFAERPFTGNPAAVIPLDAWLPDAMMQAIAGENNLSETAFTVPAADDADYELRWFTPTTEVTLCGHATLASGHVLIEGRDRIRFRTRKAGMLEVARDGDGYAIPGEFVVGSGRSGTSTVSGALTRLGLLCIAALVKPPVEPELPDGAVVWVSSSSRSCGTPQWLRRNMSASRTSSASRDGSGIHSSPPMASQAPEASFNRAVMPWWSG